MPVVMKRATANQVAIDDARLVHKDPTADFEIKRHLGTVACVAL